MDASEWRDDDDRDTDANDWDSPENATNCYAQISPTLEEKVSTFNSASAFLNSKPLHSAPICGAWQHFKTSLLCFGVPPLQLYVVFF
jgi:hypothetical protein